MTLVIPGTTVSFANSLTIRHNPSIKVISNMLVQAGAITIAHGAMPESLGDEEASAGMLSGHGTRRSKRRHGIEPVGHKEYGSSGTAREGLPRGVGVGRRRRRRRRGGSGRRGEGALEDPVGAEVEVPRIARHADVGPVGAVDGRRADLAADVAPPPGRIVARDVIAVGTEHAGAGFLEEALWPAANVTSIPESGDLAVEQPLDNGGCVAPHCVVDGLCKAPEGVARRVEGLSEQFVNVLTADDDDGPGRTDCGDWLLVEFCQPFVKAAFDCRVVVFAGEGALLGPGQVAVAEETIGQFIGIFEIGQPALIRNNISEKSLKKNIYSRHNVRVPKSSPRH